MQGWAATILIQPITALNFLNPPIKNDIKCQGQQYFHTPKKKREEKEKYTTGSHTHNRAPHTTWLSFYLSK